MISLLENNTRQKNEVFNNLILPMRFLINLIRGLMMHWFFFFFFVIAFYVNASRCTAFHCKHWTWSNFSYTCHEQSIKFEWSLLVLFSVVRRNTHRSWHSQSLLHWLSKKTIIRIPIAHKCTISFCKILILFVKM